MNDTTAQAGAVAVVPVDPTPEMVKAGTLAGMLTPNQAANHVAAGGLNTRAAQLRKLIKERSNG